MLKSSLCCLIIICALSGCTVLHILPNKSRDKYYETRESNWSESIDHLRKVRIGFSKEQVLEEWGQPYTKRSGDVWIYKFPEYFTNKIVLKFKDDVVVGTDGTMW